MAIRSIKSLDDLPIKIDLAGPDGDAFVLMSYTRALCRKLKKKHEPIIEEMMNCDIDLDRIANIFEREFGEFIVLQR